MAEKEEADCAALIAVVLAERQSRSRPDGQPWPTVEEQLAGLPDRCGPALLGHARKLIDELPATDEGELIVALAGASRRSGDRGDLLKGLLRDAIRSPHTVLKEDYATILDDLYDRIDAVESLTEVLDGTDRPDLVHVIEALAALRAYSSASAVRPYLNSADGVLRSTAIGYAYNYDTPDAAPLFLDVLRRENDPELVRTLVDGLVAWGYRDAIPELNRLAGTAKDAEIHRLLIKSAEDLAQQ